MFLGGMVVAFGCVSVWFMGAVLRGYQLELIDRVRASLNSGNRRVIVQMPTGSGKTIWAAEILKQTSYNGYSSIFLADRRKLIDQTSEKLGAYGVHHGIIMAGREPDRDAPVQVASIQTLYSRAIQREVMSLPNVQLIIIDEAHKSLGNQYVDLVRDHFPNAFVLGLTATPVRSDGRGLNEMYDDLVTGPSVQWLTDEGFLVPMRYYAPSMPDMEYLSGILDKRKGDYNELKLGQYMERNKPLIGDVVQHYKRLASDRQAVVFASSVRHSMYLAEAFKRAGISAEHIDGTTFHMERVRIFDDVHSGKTRVLTNFGVLIEGWDEPQISAVILARPTKSVATYLQMAGRVLRPYPGKRDALLIDHSGAVRELGFVHEERRWSLEPTESINFDEDPTASIVDASSDPNEKKEVIVCEVCTTVYEGRRKCPECGWEPPKRKSKPGKVLEAELEELLAAAARDEYKISFYQRALGYEKAKNVNAGWADKAYRLKFKEPPPEVTKVQAPDDEIRKWHQHMVIREKFRKSPRRMREG
jgi:DNA repair protein RadD